MPAPYSGGCACGAIRYTVTAEPYTSYRCHCSACQKRTSSAFGLSAQVPAASLAFQEGTPETRLRTAESGNLLTVHFCGDCGTSLYSASTGRPHVHVLYIGTLDDPAAIEEHDRGEGRDMDGDLEEQILLLLVAEQDLEHREVPGARDGEELRQALDDPQQRGLERVQAAGPRMRGGGRRAGSYHRPPGSLARDAFPR